MLHLVEVYDFKISRNLRLRKFAGFGLDPVKYGKVGHPKQAPDHPETHVTHAVEQQRQRLLRRMLPVRRRRRKIAAACCLIQESISDFLNRHALPTLKAGTFPSDAKR